jgi:hypothetical protein
MADTRVIGWKIYYGDGSVLTSEESTWSESPSEGVLIADVFFEETYRRYVRGTWVTENYKDILRGFDYYWQNPDGSFAAGQARDVPEDLPDGSLKLGELVSEVRWVDVCNRAKADRVWHSR